MGPSPWSDAIVQSLQKIESVHRNEDEETEDLKFGSLREKMVCPRLGNAWKSLVDTVFKPASNISLRPIGPWKNIF
jgi:hypothetical protein